MLQNRCLTSYPNNDKTITNCDTGVHKKLIFYLSSITSLIKFILYVNLKSCLSTSHRSVTANVREKRAVDATREENTRVRVRIRAYAFVRICVYSVRAVGICQNHALAPSCHARTSKQASKQACVRRTKEALESSFTTAAIYLSSRPSVPRDQLIHQRFLTRSSRSKMQFFCIKKETSFAILCSVKNITIIRVEPRQNKEGSAVEEVYIK